jgi:hypothetical protein
MEGPLGDTRSPCRSTSLHASGAPCRSRTAARGCVDPVLHSQALTLHFLIRSLHPSPPCSLFLARPAALPAMDVGIELSNHRPLLIRRASPSLLRVTAPSPSCAAPPRLGQLAAAALAPPPARYAAAAARSRGQTASAGRGPSWKSPRPRAGPWMGARPCQGHPGDPIAGIAVFPVVPCSEKAGRTSRMNSTKGRDLSVKPQTQLNSARRTYPLGLIKVSSRGPVVKCLSFSV